MMLRSLHHRKYWRVVAFAGLVLCFAGQPAWAQEEAEPPAPPGQPVIAVTVTKVEGAEADVRGPEEVWVPAEVGMLLPAGAEVSTGFETIVTLQLANQALIRIEACSYVVIEELLAQQDRGRGYFYLRTGRLQMYVEEGLEADFQITTPRLTTAVRGTEMEVEASDDRGDRVRTLKGKVAARLRNEFEPTVGAGRSAVTQTQGAITRSPNLGSQAGQWRMQTPGQTDQSDRLSNGVTPAPIGGENRLGLRQRFARIVGANASGLGTSRGGSPLAHTGVPDPTQSSRFLEMASAGFIGGPPPPAFNLAVYLETGDQASYSLAVAEAGAILSDGEEIKRNRLLLVFRTQRGQEILAGLEGRGQ